MDIVDTLPTVDTAAVVSDQFEATISWVSETEMLPGRMYLLRAGTKIVGVTIQRPKYKIHGAGLRAAKTLCPNEVGVCNIALEQPIDFGPHADNRDTGAFVVIDPFSNEMVGTVLPHFALRRSKNVHWQSITVDKQAHADLKGQKPCVIWFTGLSGAGKSTIANVVEQKLYAFGKHTYLLDGDNVRHGLCRDLGFTTADRIENVRRVAEVAGLMVDAGLIVLVSFISPFASERQMARRRVAEGEFCEVFVDVPLAVAEQRDPKGLYRKARRGELPNFTGIDSPYEPPANPEVHVNTSKITAAHAATLVIEKLQQLGILQQAG